MSLYIFITENEMIDGASIEHMKLDDGVLTILLTSHSELTFRGPHAVKVYDKLKAAFIEDNDLNQKNADLIKNSWEILTEQGPGPDPMGPPDDWF